MPDRIGQQLANYRLIRQLGQGGFADVYLGEHVYLNTPAAIKVLQMRLTDEDKQNFLEEARTIAHLKHPSIVRILEYDVVDSIPFLVMEYAPNGTLRQCHPKGAVLPPASIAPYVRQVAAALQYAHDQKLIHRDVKPENMLLGYKNAVLLSDFGLAVIAHSSRDRLQTVAGTVTYMAPEQLQGKACPASDQYALAAVIYEWLTGERLFSGSFIEVASQHVLVPPPSLRGKNPALSPAIDLVIQKALSKNAEQRFANVLEFATAFEQVCKADLPKPHTSAPVPMGKLITPYRKHSAPVLSIAWSPDGKKIASASADKTVHIWNATSKNPILIYRNHNKSVSAVAWSPDGSRIVSGSWDTSVQVWHVQSGRKLFTYQGHTSPVYGVAWSPVNSSSSESSWRLASASGAAGKADVDNTVQIWYALTGSNLLIYRDHFYFVTAVAWSPDGTRIASASDDRTVQVWDATTGETIFTYRGHAKEISSVTWSPNGTRIASAGYDTMVHVWHAK